MSTRPPGRCKNGHVGRWVRGSVIPAAEFAAWIHRESANDERNFREAIFSKASDFTSYLAVEAEELLFFIATRDTGVGRPQAARLSWIKDLLAVRGTGRDVQGFDQRQAAAERKVTSPL